MIEKTIVWYNAITEHPWKIGLAGKDIKYIIYMSKGYLFSANFNGTYFFLSSGGIFGTRDGDMYAIIETPTITEK